MTASRDREPLLRSQSAQAADLTPFRIGISAPVVTIFPVWMGEAGGFYEKEGLKVEVVTMEGGSRGVQVLMSGEIQAMHVGLAPVVLANKQGADLRLVTSTGNTIPITIFGTPAIKSMADLKGKTVGISTFGSETDIAISIALKNARLSRQDVTDLADRRQLAAVRRAERRADRCRAAARAGHHHGEGKRLQPAGRSRGRQDAVDFRFGGGDQQLHQEPARHAHAFRARPTSPAPISRCRTRRRPRR